MWVQWSLKWGVMANLWHVLIFQIAVTLKRLLKQLVLHVQLVKGDVVERKSKKNRIFYGCSNYPECDFISWDKPIGRDCPKCEHYLVEKKKDAVVK